MVQTKLSGDQGADLIIRKGGHKTVVQAKKYSGMVSNKAIQEVVAAKNHYNCNNSMVVTTGEFTKSAIQLAVSNGVDLWDKKKLQKVVNEINQPNEKNRRESQNITTKPENDVMPFTCPYCKSKNTVPIDQMPRINEKTEIDCPECGLSLTMSLDNDQYACKGCKKEFETLNSLNNHVISCKMFKERSFNCNHCEKIFILNNDELIELKKNGKIEIICPSCQAANSLDLEL